MHYLNKSGYVPNSYSFFDPYVLLILSSSLAIWGLRYKESYLGSYLPGNTFMGLALGSGIVFFSSLNLNFLQGVDAIFESFHYLILYFHIGFGVFFFIYIIINFIDPLIQGFAVYKITYREQNFPYVSARLGGLVVILGLYFLSNQEAYQLLRSGYYVHLANKEETIGNPTIANEYYQQAAYLGYNTHYPNYQIAWLYSDKGNDYLTKVHFEKAASRHPSPFTYINYSLLSEELNSVKAWAFLDQATTKFNDGEIINNQGLMRFNRNEWDESLVYFQDAEASNVWNQAPLLNKWATYFQTGGYDSTEMGNDYNKGNLGVKANILTQNTDPSIKLSFQQIFDEPILHRQAYLLNAASMFQEDTLAGLINETIDTSINANLNNQLRKALAIYYYKKGDVNKAFRMLDILQANASENGSYLNDLGILAFDQKAYQLSLNFFDRAVAANYEAAKINRLEALAWLNRSDEIPQELIQIVQNDPGLTSYSNQLLSNLINAKFDIKPTPIPPNLASLESNTLISIGKKNAFNEDLVYQVVSILNERQVNEAYDLILDATEINPYSVRLLTSYVFTALKQNFVSYAESTVSKIEELSKPEDFDSFLEEYNERLKELSQSDW